MDKLKKLISECECGVYVTVNEHRDMYETAAQWLEKQDLLGDTLTDTTDEVRAKIVARGVVVDVQFYPTSPVGFHRVVHFDLDKALDQALACLGVVEDKRPPDYERTILDELNYIIKDQDHYELPIRILDAIKEARDEINRFVVDRGVCNYKGPCEYRTGRVGHNEV